MRENCVGAFTPGDDRSTVTHRNRFRVAARATEAAHADTELLACVIGSKRSRGAETADTAAAAETQGINAVRFPSLGGQDALVRDLDPTAVPAAAAAAADAHVQTLCVIAQGDSTGDAKAP